MRYISPMALGLILFACGVPKQGIQKEQKNAFSYEVGGETVAIDYENKNPSQADSIDLQVRVNDKLVDVSVSSTKGLQNFDGHGAVLSHEERNALAQAALDYSKQNSISDSSPLEQKAVFQVFDYLSQAPENYALPSRNFNNLSLKNDGITCIKKGTTVKAQWSTKLVPLVAEDIMVGANWPNNYGCMGRCGGDCGWGAPSAWTKDCLDHDACSFRNSASGGASDPNCGDEFNEAADDWIGGVWAGCNGK